MLVARSAWESAVYLGLADCQACGGQGFEFIEQTTLRDGAGEGWTYETTCRNCDVPRRFEFAVAAAPRHAYPDFGGAEPSQLLDAGQFLAISEFAADEVPADPDGLTPDERANAHQAIAIAVAAVREALKFVPVGASAVPAVALYSSSGRQMYAADPYRFQRRQLLALLGTYREVQTAYEESG